jgi:four helix bundle protein
MSNRVNSFNELENRCLEFSLNVKSYCSDVKQDMIHQDYILQVIRSSAAIGSNIIEANEKLGEDNLIHKMKIARKESKETIYWLHHFDESEERDFLLDEVDQLRKILSSIISKLSLNAQANNYTN